MVEEVDMVVTCDCTAWHEAGDLEGIVDGSQRIKTELCCLEADRVCM